MTVTDEYIRSIEEALKEKESEKSSIKGDIHNLKVTLRLFKKGKG